MLIYYRNWRTIWTMMSWLALSMFSACILVGHWSTAVFWLPNLAFAIGMRRWTRRCEAREMRRLLDEWEKR